MIDESYLVNLIIIAFLYLAIRTWNDRQKHYIKITYIDSRGTVESPAFNVSVRADEVQSLISRMLNNQQAGQPSHAVQPDKPVASPQIPLPDTPAVTMRQQATQAAYPSEPQLGPGGTEASIQTSMHQEAASKAQPSKPKTFRSGELMAAYRSMRAQYENGLVNEEGYTSYVLVLRFIDESGKPWVIGRESGSWYSNDGVSWRIGEPPELLIITG